MRQIRSTMWMLAVIACMLPLTAPAANAAPGGSQSVQGQAPADPPAPRIAPPTNLRVQTFGQSRESGRQQPRDEALIGGLEEKDAAIKTVQAASRVLMTALGQPETGIPRWAMERAAALVVVPDAEAGMTADPASPGAPALSGILVTRQQDQWSLPVFIKLTGDMSDIPPGPFDLLVLLNDPVRLQQMLQEGSFTLAAEAGPAADPPVENTPPAPQVDMWSYQARDGRLSGLPLPSVELNVAQGPTTAYYDLSEQSVRGYYGNERQMILALLGFAEGRSIQNIPRSARNLQDILKLYTPPALR